MCAFFAFLVVKSKLMIRFEKVKRPLTLDIIAQKIMKSCDVISGFYFELKSAIFCRFQLLTSNPAKFSQQKSDPTHIIADSEYIKNMIICVELTEE